LYEKFKDSCTDEEVVEENDTSDKKEDLQKPKIML